MIMNVLFMSCAHSYNKTVEFVDRDRFMGTWYVLAGRFTPFEKNVFNAVEKYKWNDKKQIIEVDFSYNQGSLTGPVKKVPQTAWIVNHDTNATWKVSPIWPLRFTYLVVALDPDYRWTAIGVPGEDYLWIMTRDPKFSREELKNVIGQLDAVGYSTENLIYVEHN